MDRARAAIRTARSLLAQGLLGPALTNALTESYPDLSQKERQKVARALKAEIGVLGQVIHDPNLYKSCRQAAKAKEAHPHPHTLVCTARTPYCGTCGLNRKGSCALMGGRLVSSAEAIPEEAVRKTASMLVNGGQLPAPTADKIVASDLPAGKRAAALHLHRLVPNNDPVQDVKAHADSRRMAAVLHNPSQSPTIEYIRPNGQRRVANADQREDRESFISQPGDDQISRRARRTAALLAPSPMKVEVPGEPNNPVRQDVKLRRTSVFDVPKTDKGRRAGAEDEHLQQIQVRHDRIVRIASRLLSHGQVNLSTATKLYSVIDTLRQNGAHPSRTAAQITQQLEVLTGALEL
jgi:hypothetical protein